MKNLEKIIKNNIEAYNSYEPSNEHFEKFKRKLQQHNIRVKPEIYHFLYRIAGILIIVVIISGILFFTGLINSGRTITSIGHISAEYHEVEMYYRGQINENYEIIKELNFKNNGKTRKNILSELKEMDFAYKDLQKDLNQNPCDERVINAIITYYQFKIEFMDQIITQTRKINI